MNKISKIVTLILPAALFLSACGSVSEPAQAEAVVPVERTVVSVSVPEPAPEPEPVYLKDCFKEASEFIFSLDDLKTLIESDSAAKITVETDKTYTIYLGVKDETKPMVVTVYDGEETAEFADVFETALSDEPSVLEVFNAVLDKEELTEVLSTLSLSESFEVTEEDKDKALSENALTIEANGLSCVLETKEDVVYPAAIGNGSVTVKYDAVEDVATIADLLIEPPYTFSGMEAVKYAKSKTKVMSLPSKDGEELGALSLNDEVTITGQCHENGWFRVAYNDSVGYIDSKQLMNQKYVDEATRMKSDPNVVWEGGYGEEPYSVDGYVLNTPILENNDSMYIYYLQDFKYAKHLGLCQQVIMYRYTLVHPETYSASIKRTWFTTPGGYKIVKDYAVPGYLEWEHDENGNRTGGSRYTSDPNADILSVSEIAWYRDLTLGSYENTLRNNGFDQWIAR